MGSFRRALFSLLGPSKILIQNLQRSWVNSQKLILASSLFQTRSYISEMRKSAFEANILRLLRNEIDFELQSATNNKPVGQLHSYTVHDRPGEQWITLIRNFGETEEIKVEVTMFDGSLPVPKSNKKDLGEDVQLHITFIVTICKASNDNVLEVMCSAWQDSIEIQKLFMRARDAMPVQAYTGPAFKELDDELQNALCDFLDLRGINDELAVFLHAYMKKKDKTEFIHWMETLKTFIEKKR